MTKQEIDQLTNEELSKINLVYSVRTSQAKLSYSIIRNALGRDSEAATILWNAYVALDEEANPYRIVEGQRMMQAQREHMTAEEWSAIVD